MDSSQLTPEKGKVLVQKAKFTYNKPCSPAVAENYKSKWSNDDDCEEVTPLNIQISSVRTVDDAENCFAQLPEKSANEDESINEETDLSNELKSIEKGKSESENDERNEDQVEKLETEEEAAERRLSENDERNEDQVEKLETEEEAAERRLKEKEEKRKAMEAEIEKEEARTRTEKLKQFQHLLSKSQFYMNFFQKRIAAQKMEHEENERKNGNRKKPSQENVEIRSRRDRPIKRKRLQLCDLIEDSHLQESVAEETEPANKKTKKETFNRTIDGEPVSDRQPKWFTGGVMRSYQLDGFEWLRSLYENGLNGILADEMGLGKTVQTISLICYLIERDVAGPHLIVAPFSTLTHWVAEFSRFAPDIPTTLYHGEAKYRHSLRRRMIYRVAAKDKSVYPVIITNYETIIRDVQELQSFSFRFIVIDEGHRIKNFNCQLIKALKSLNSRNRILLTGTPLQNNLSELWSLLNFILPEVFDKLQVFESLFNVDNMNNDESDEKIAEEEQRDQVVSTLHQILTPFLLRRLKSDVELFIPPKKELIVYAPLTNLQQEYYKRTVDRTIFNIIKPETVAPLPEKRKRKLKNPTEFLMSYLDDDLDIDEYLEIQDKHVEMSKSLVKEETLITNKHNIKMQNVMMMLRKCCNHPYLLNYPLDKDGKLRVDEELVRFSGKLLVLDAMLPKLKERGHKVLIFSQMTMLMDLLQDYCDLRKFRFSILDGRMKMQERQENIERFKEDPETFIFLLSTRAGGLGLNLTAADTVFVYDSDWNPQCDLQAVDRCHRIGQNKPVVIYRLVTKNTIDQRVVERAASKRKLEKMVMHKDKFKSGRQDGKKYFTKSEMLDLLKSRDHERVVQTGTENCVFTEEELEALLDRSKMEANTTSSKDHVFKVVEEIQSTAF